jgi:hypothetical protein
LSTAVSKLVIRLDNSTPLVTVKIRVGVMVMVMVMVIVRVRVRVRVKVGVKVRVKVKGLKSYGELEKIRDHIRVTGLG